MEAGTGVTLGGTGGRGTAVGAGVGHGLGPGGTGIVHVEGEQP